MHEEFFLLKPLHTPLNDKHNELNKTISSIFHDSYLQLSSSIENHQRVHDPWWLALYQYICILKSNLILLKRKEIQRRYLSNLVIYLNFFEGTLLLHFFFVSPLVALDFRDFLLSFRIHLKFINSFLCLFIHTLTSQRSLYTLVPSISRIINVHFTP